MVKLKLNILLLLAICSFGNVLSVLAGSNTPARLADGKGDVTISGELKEWHKVTLTLDGPFATETDESPNPLTDLTYNVTFTHQSSTPSYTVPGYFAADGDAANSSAESGTKWRAHLSPDKPGTWKYRVSFTQGKNAALNGGGESLKAFDGVSGSFQIAAGDKTGRDFRCRDACSMLASITFSLPDRRSFSSI